LKPGRASRFPRFRQRTRVGKSVCRSADQPDDWGLEPLGPEQRRDLLEIVEEQYGRGATQITSQIPVERWIDLIGDPTLADAILDRLVHNAHRIQLRGESLRKKKAQEQG
jgi:DNA replication protein DnaC